MIDKIASAIVATVVLTLIYFTIYGFSAIINVPHSEVGFILFGGYIWSVVYKRVRE